MGKKYFYEFNGNVYLEANDQAEAEKLVTGISLDNYLIDEELYKIDENYVANDLKKREEQWGTYLHLVNHADEYQEFKMRECRYGNIFKEFLHGKFDKNELMKRMTKAEEKNLNDYALVDEISMVDLIGKKLKTVKHCIVD